MPTQELPGVAAVNRALTLLDVLGKAPDGLSLNELSAQADLYPSTVLRLVESLEAFRYIKRLPDGRFVLGPTPFFLGSVYQQGFRSAERVLPVLRELTRTTGESVALYVREGDARVCLHRTDSTRSVRDHVHEGDRFALEHGAAGKVLLAFGGATGKAFDTIRKRGYAISEGERDPETAALSCPVFATGQALFGALSLSVPRYRYNAAWRAAMLPPLQQAADRLTLDLGGTPIHNTGNA